MASANRYTFFRIPKTPSVETMARQYRELRLKALETSPKSFSSTYEIESAFTEEEWASRILQEDRENFICAVTHIDSKELPSSEWIGQVTVRGPIGQADFTLPEAAGRPLPASDEEKWQVLSLFILSDYRGQGLAQKLCLEALSYLQAHQSMPALLVRLMVKPDNPETIHLYQKLGFATVGKCTLAEALVANGDAHLLPNDITGAKYSARTGLIMEYAISRK